MSWIASLSETLQEQSRVGVKDGVIASFLGFRPARQPALLRADLGFGEGVLLGYFYLCVCLLACLFNRNLGQTIQLRSKYF